MFQSSANLGTAPAERQQMCENKKLNFEPLAIPIPSNKSNELGIVFQIKEVTTIFQYHTSFVTKSKGCLKHLPTLGMTKKCKTK